MANSIRKIDQSMATLAALADYDRLLLDGVDAQDAFQQVVAFNPAQARVLCDHILQKSIIGDDSTEFVTSELSDTLSAFDRIAASTSARMRQTQGFAGILAQASKVGLTPALIAEKLSLGLSVLRKLDQRLISLSTIPAQIIESLAQELKVQSAQITGYLSATPKLAASADYKSRKAPRTVQRQQAFDDAVKAAIKSGEMSQDDSARWIQDKGQ